MQRIPLRARCDIHSEELAIGRLDMTHDVVNGYVLTLQVADCSVNDGCSEENYVVERRELASEPLFDPS